MSYAQRNGIKYDPLETNSISLAVIKKIAAEDGIEFKQGDILFVRSGWEGRYTALSQEERIKISELKQHQFTGVEQSVDMAKFLWDTGFAACAGDAPSWEAWPHSQDESKGRVNNIGFLLKCFFKIGFLLNCF